MVSNDAEIPAAIAEVEMMGTGEQRGSNQRPKEHECVKPPCPSVIRWPGGWPDGLAAGPYRLFTIQGVAAVEVGGASGAG